MPLAPPPSAHLAKTGSGLDQPPPPPSLVVAKQTSFGTSYASSGAGGGGAGREGTIPIGLSSSASSSAATPGLGTRSLAGARPPTRKGESRFTERDSVWLAKRLAGGGGEDVPPVPPIADEAPPSPAFLPARINRKTILERIEGWWDLGLLRGGTVKGRKKGEVDGGAFV